MEYLAYFSKEIHYGKIKTMTGYYSNRKQNETFIKTLDGSYHDL